MAKRRRSNNSGKKRTISPEHLKKMQEGRERKRKNIERMEGVRELEERLRKGARGY